MKVPLSCVFGKHKPLIYGLGLMGDAVLCLSCGHEWYHNYPGVPEGATVITEENKEELWPKIEEARKLPAGINS